MSGVEKNKSIVIETTRSYCFVCNPDAASCTLRLHSDGTKEVISYQKSMEESFVHLPRNSHDHYYYNATNSGGNKTTDGQKNHHFWGRRNHNIQIVQTGLLDSCNQVTNFVNLCTNYSNMEQEADEERSSDSGDRHTNELFQFPVLCASCTSRYVVPSTPISLVFSYEKKNYFESFSCRPTFEFIILP